MPTRRSTPGLWNSGIAGHFHGAHAATSSGPIIVLAPVGRRVHPARSEIFVGAIPLPSGTRTSRAAEPSAYLMLKPRTLQQACHDTGRDDAGERCPVCDLRDFCERQATRMTSPGGG